MEIIGRAPVLKNDLWFVEDRTNSMLGPGRRLVEFLLNISICYCVTVLQCYCVTVWIYPSVTVPGFICQNNDTAQWLMKSLSVFPSIPCLIKSRLLSRPLFETPVLTTIIAQLWKMVQHGKISEELISSACLGVYRTVLQQSESEFMQAEPLYVCAIVPACKMHLSKFVFFFL